MTDDLIEKHYGKRAARRHRAPAEAYRLERPCIRCGYFVDLNVTPRCPECGAFQPPPPVPRQREAACTRLTYILLALVLGGLGIHNFVAGRWFSGLCQLIVLLLAIVLTLTLIGLPLALLMIFLLWVWAIVEICAVSHDGKGTRMR